MSNKIGIANDLVNFEGYSTGYFGIIKTIVDTVVLNQLTNYYQKYHDENTRQVTNPGEFVEWELLEGGYLINQGLKTK